MALQINPSDALSFTVQNITVSVPTDSAAKLPLWQYVLPGATTVDKSRQLIYTQVNLLRQFSIFPGQ